MSEARWLDRDALAEYISVRVDQVARLQKAGRLPAPSYAFGPKSPRWWSAAVDEALGRKPASAPADHAVQGLVHEILAGKGRPQEARGRHR